MKHTRHNNPQWSYHLQSQMGSFSLFSNSLIPPIQSNIGQPRFQSDFQDCCSSLQGMIILSPTISQGETNRQ